MNLYTTSDPTYTPSELTPALAMRRGSRGGGRKVKLGRSQPGSPNSRLGHIGTLNLKPFHLLPTHTRPQFLGGNNDWLAPSAGTCRRAREPYDGADEMGKYSIDTGKADHEEGTCIVTSMSETIGRGNLDSGSLVERETMYLTIVARARGKGASICERRCGYYGDGYLISMWDATQNPNREKKKRLAIRSTSISYRVVTVIRALSCARFRPGCASPGP